MNFLAFLLAGLMGIIAFAQAVRLPLFFIHSLHRRSKQANKAFSGLTIFLGSCYLWR